MRLVTMLAVLLVLAGAEHSAAQDLAARPAAAPLDAPHGGPTQAVLGIDLRLEELYAAHDRTRLAWPIVMMSLGYPGGASLLFPAVEALLTEQPYDTSEAYVRERRRIGGFMLALSLSGLALGVYGNVLLMRRLRNRRELEEQIQVLRRQRLSYAVEPLSSRVTLRLVF